MKLTGLSKFLITVVVLGAAAAGVYRYTRQAGSIAFWKQGNDEGKTGDGTPATKEAPARKGGKTHIVVGVNDFGGAYPGIVANDGATAGPNSLFSKAGLDVEIRLVPGSKERLEQFDGGQVDVMLLTLDYLANLYPVYHAKGTEVQAFMMVDWSRGNLGLVTKPGINTIEDLKKARIATTRNTPTHYFIFTLLDRSNLGAADIAQVKDSLVFAKKTPLAGEMFQRGEVDAVAIWEPHLSRAAAEGKGHLLVSTATATNLIADVLFARSAFLDANADVMPAFVNAWFEGVERLHKDRAGSVALIARAFKQQLKETDEVLSKIKPATFADNRAFFGLETESSPYSILFGEAAQIWKREDVIKEIPDPRKAMRTKFLEAVAGRHAGEKVVEDFEFKAGKAKGDALLSKSVSIFFPSGSAELDANARRIVDDFANRTVGVFQNAYVRVEGNTDSVGNRKLNTALSKQRADAVVDYLVSRHRFDAARFVPVGNGPGRPVADNKTEQGRELNRRTDFRVVPNY